MWTLQGIGYAGAGQVQPALASYGQALAVSPDYLPALEGAAELNYQQHNRAAKPLLEHVLKLRPDDPITHAMLATIDYNAGDCSDAVFHFSQAQPVLASSPLSLSQYGVCLYKMNNSEEAISRFRQAAALEPKNNATSYNLSLMLWKANRPADALEQLQPALQSAAAGEDILTLAADIYEASNDTPHAVELLHRAILEQPRDPRAYLWFATLASSHMSYQVGIDMLDAGLTQLPAAAQLHLARGVLYAELGKFDKATDDFVEANRIDPQLSFAGTAQGIVATQQHDLQKGIAKFRELIRKHPDSAFDHYLLAESIQQQGAAAGSAEYEEGIRAAKRAVHLDPGLMVARGVLANLYLRTDNTSLAAEECEATLRIDPNNQEALYHLILSIRRSARQAEIPALTKRLLAARDARENRESHITRYQLVDNVTSQHPAPETSDK